MKKIEYIFRPWILKSELVAFISIIAVVLIIIITTAILVRKELKEKGENNEN